MPVLLIALLAADAPAAGTPAAGTSTRFLGDGLHQTDAADLPLEWDDLSGTAWQHELPGPGSSTPLLLGDRIYVTCYTGFGVNPDDEGKVERSELVRHLVCLRAADGAEVWRASQPARMPEDPYNGFLREHGYATNSPVTDGERVFVFHGKSGVFAYDLDGRQLWTADVGQETSVKAWGSAATPLVVPAAGDQPAMLIVNASEESAALYAFDCRTGELLWKSEADSLRQSYATPRLATVDGRRQIVLGVPGELWGMAVETGKLIWYAEVPVPSNVSPTPAIADGVAYLVGGRPGGSAAVRLAGTNGEPMKGDVTDSNVLWTSRKSSYVPSPVVKDGRVFFVSDKGIAVCLDAATGEVIKERRIATGGGFLGMAVYSSVLLAGDRLYCVTRTGGTYVLAADPTLRTLAHNELTDPTQFNASPVAVDGRLYLRSDLSLYAIGQ